MTQIYKKILHGDLTPANATPSMISSVQGDEVYVTPEIIESMLKKYLVDLVDEQLLSDWAKFLISHDVYVTEGWENDDQADKYEPMWEILQQLSAPFVDGEISKNRVENYINELSNIENNNYNQ